MISYSRTLKYRHAEQFLRYHASLLAPGEGMPPIRLLCSVSGIGRLVIQNVLADLVEQGILECRDRSGYYRSAHPLFDKNDHKTIDIFACSHVGYLSPNVFFPQKFFNSIFTLADKANYNCRVHRIHLDESIVSYEDKIAEYNVGLALLFSPHSDEICKCFEKRCVRWACVFPRFVARQGPYLAESADIVTAQMQFLYDRGHRKIAFIDEQDDVLSDSTFLTRRERYYRFMAEKWLKVEKNYVFQKIFEKKPLHEQFDKLFSNKPPSAIVVPGSILLPFYVYCNEKGIKIGKDISVITFEKRPDLNLKPEPASLSYDFHDIAEMTFNSLLDIDKGKSKNNLYFPTEIYSGGSVVDIS